MADSPAPIPIKVADRSLYVSGAIMAPNYLARCPEMLAVSDLDIKNIGTLEAVVVACYSLAAFFAGIDVNIVLGASISTAPLAPVGAFLLYKASWFFGVMVLGFIIGGASAAKRKVKFSRE